MKSFFLVLSGIIGCYHIDFSLYFDEEVNDFHFVNITWNRETSAFTWKNKAGVSWNLTPIIIDGELDTTKLAVGVDCPYYESEDGIHGRMDNGYKFAALEWEGLPGSSKVLSIIGPSGPYYACSYNPQGTSFSLNTKYCPCSTIGHLYTC